MKKLICLLLALAMAVSLFGCIGTPNNQDDSQVPPSSSDPATEPSTATATEPSTEEPSQSVEIPPEPTAELPEEPERVSVDNQVDYTPEGAVIPSVADAVNVQFKDKYGNKGSLKLPKIELPGSNVEAINAEILNDYSDYVRSGDDTRQMNYSDVYYEWGVHGDILSVLIVCGGSVFDGGWEDYDGCDRFSLYNISISKCRLVSNEEVYAASGMENVKTRVLHAIANFGCQWRGKDADTIEVFYHDPVSGWSLSCLQEELTDKNFAKAVPYFDEDGELCVMGTIYTFIGAGLFYGMIELDDYHTDSLSTAEEYYQHYYQLYH